MQSHQEIFDLLDSKIVSEIWSKAFKLVQPIKINGTLDGLLSLMLSSREERHGMPFMFCVSDQRDAK